MFIGIVVGSVVASHKIDLMDGLPLRLVRRITPDNKETDTYFVAVDGVGASDGEYVLAASGSTARQTTLTDNKPVDAIIMAIVDEWQLQGQLIYQNATQVAKHV